MIYPYIKSLLIIILFTLSGCSSKEASHLPSIWELPGALIGSVIENSSYNHTRNKVKNYVITYYDVLNHEIENAKGEHLDTLLKQADINAIASVKKSLQESYQTMFHNTLLSTEAVIQSFGALYLSEEKTKTMNGFTYTQASNIAKNYLEKHFTAFRLSLKNRTTQGLKPFIQKLHIDDYTKQKQFYETLWKRYDALIIEPVVVGVMVHTN